MQNKSLYKLLILVGIVAFLLLVTKILMKSAQTLLEMIIFNL